MPNIDFNGDGRSDVLWLYNTREIVSNWLGTATGGFVNNDANAFYQIDFWYGLNFEATGDFNGDGRTDVLWMSGGLYSPYQTITYATPAGGLDVEGSSSFVMADLLWEVVGAGDFNGDGVDDILWRHYDGTISNWLGSTAGTFTVNDANAKAFVPNGWHILGTGDFNGDGREDILWQSDDGYISNWLGKADGGYVINDANALTRMRVQVSAIGDFDGDGRDDIVIYDEWQFHSIWYADANGGLHSDAYNPIAMMDTAWQIVGAGDYNGDGIDDLLWRNTTDGAFSNWLGTTTRDTFTINDANALVHVPLGWQVADDPMI